MAFDRRSMLLHGTLGSAAFALGCEDEKRPAPPKVTTSNTGETSGVAPTNLSASSEAREQLLLTLTAVADRILPPEPDKTGPQAKGAAAFGAKAFFDWVLADLRMAHLRRPLSKGADFLDRGAKLESKVDSFAALSTADQDSWLDRLNRNQVRPNGIRGSDFMRVMTALTLEAVLSDPRHGGNVDKDAWKWLSYSESGRGGVPT